MQILWAETYTLVQNMHFYLNIQYVRKTQLHPICHLRPSCIHMTIYGLNLSKFTMTLLFFQDFKMEGR